MKNGVFFRDCTTTLFRIDGPGRLKVHSRIVWGKIYAIRAAPLDRRAEANTRLLYVEYNSRGDGEHGDAAFTGAPKPMFRIVQVRLGQLQMMPVSSFLHK